jgi:ABC-2 type transport system permease protein
VNRALFRLALRRLLLRRRSILLALAPMLAALVAVVQAADGTADAKAFSSLMEQLFLPTILPFLALVIGASAIGEERDDGTILYLTSTPLSRLAIVLPAIVAAALTTIVLCLPGLAIVIALSQGDDFSASASAWAIASVVAGACAYTAVFGALSLRVKRPVVIGLIYVLFWEGSIATFAPSARWLSLAAYQRAVVAGGLPEFTDYNVPAIGAFAAAAVSSASWRPETNGAVRDPPRHHPPHHDGRNPRDGRRCRGRSRRDRNDDRCRRGGCPCSGRCCSTRLGSSTSMEGPARATKAGVRSGPIGTRSGLHTRRG